MAKETYRMKCVVTVHPFIHDNGLSLQQEVQERLDDGWTFRGAVSDMAEIQLVFVRKEPRE